MTRVRLPAVGARNSYRKLSAWRACEKWRSELPVRVKLALVAIRAFGLYLVQVAGTAVQGRKTTFASGVLEVACFALAVRIGRRVRVRRTKDGRRFIEKVRGTGAELGGKGEKSKQANDRRLDVP